MRLIDADELSNNIKSLPYLPVLEWVKEIYKLIDNASTVGACSIIDELNNQIDDLAENLAWYINQRNRLLKE